MQLSRRILMRLGTRKALRAAAPASTVLLAPVGLAPTYPTLLVAAAGRPGRPGRLGRRRVRRVLLVDRLLAHLERLGDLLP